MAESTIWWVLAGALVAIELITGTFYLLMLSLGMVAAALSAHAGVTTPVQILFASAFGCGSVVAWRIYRKSRPAPAGASANRSVNLDIGETVQVEAWRPDGTSHVKYRGADWLVSPEAGDVPTPGPHRIVEVVGSRLIVKKSKKPAE